MSWFIDCLKCYGLSEEEAEKVINSDDKIICTLKDVIFDAYSVMADMQEELNDNVQPNFESLTDEEKHNVVSIFK